MHPAARIEDSRPLPLAESSRILVVDDNEMNREMLSRRLNRQGYAVEEAEDGLRALEIARAGAFDLILLDIMMPVMNGYEVLEQLKADTALHHVPVVVISAIDDLDSVVRCLELGADDYLSKPFNPAILRARVEGSLAKKRLHDRERLYLQSLEHELEIGRRIQRGFLPAELPRVAGWEIGARFHPARQVAGDFYDVFTLGPDRIGLIIADVCGKGLGAALFMALFRSLLRAQAERLYALASDGASPGDAVLVEAMAGTNDYITSVHKSAHVFASVFFGLLDPGSGVLQYVNAGHVPPVVLRPQDSQVRLVPTGPALGLLPEARFEVAKGMVGPGETLLAFTDGLTEARDEKKGFFSEERLLVLLTEPPASVDALLDRIEQAVQSYAGEAAPSDDLTLLAIRHVTG